MQLLIDIGNTTIHYVIFEKTTTIINHHFSSKIKNDDFIRKLELDISQYLWAIKSCVISSVKPELNLAVEFLKEKYNWKYLLVNCTLRTNFTYEIDNFTSLGADLVATATGAVATNTNQDIIIIDMGTATTITCIKNNAFIGGAILPGITISGNALIDNTALLNQRNWQWLPDSQLIGKNTNDCLNIGIIYGHAMAIKGIVSNYETQLDNAVILLTGGNSYYVKSILKYQIQNDLIFIGLKELYKINQGEN